jgi:hypothetical protein
MFLFRLLLLRLVGQVLQFDKVFELLKEQKLSDQQQQQQLLLVKSLFRSRYLHLLRCSSNRNFLQ